MVIAQFWLDLTLGYSQSWERETKEEREVVVVKGEGDESSSAYGTQKFDEF